MKFLFFLAIAIVRGCELPLDILFLQDTTSSLGDDVPNIADQISSITAEVTKRYPNSRFGVAEFRDKPFAPFGASGDYCYRLPEHGKLTSNFVEFHDAYAELVADGGADLPEAQYHAIINAVLDKNVGWRDLYRPDTAGQIGVAARIILLITDAVPHIAGDVRFVRDKTLQFMESSGTIDPTRPGSDCLTEDYPGPEQVKQVLQDAHVHLMIFTPNWDSVVPAWTWVNSDLLGQDERFYQFTEPNSIDFSRAMEEALKTISLQIPCYEHDTTTTQAPITGTQTSTTDSSAPDTTSSASIPGTPASISEIASGSSVPQDCSKCPCQGPLPCDRCDAGCEGAVYLRLAKKPKHLQVVVENE